ncbi:unnamed protein product [Pedinophyceae sp. YPF-701]|nr:unnamed protein product [Pedinophyceae sp. YPF-701]
MTEVVMGEDVAGNGDFVEEDDVPMSEPGPDAAPEAAQGPAPQPGGDPSLPRSPDPGRPQDALGAGAAQGASKASSRRSVAPATDASTAADGAAKAGGGALPQREAGAPQKRRSRRPSQGSRASSQTGGFGRAEAAPPERAVSPPRASPGQATDSRHEPGPSVSGAPTQRTVRVHDDDGDDGDSQPFDDGVLLPDAAFEPAGPRLRASTGGAPSLPAVRGASAREAADTPGKHRAAPMRSSYDSKMEHRFGVLRAQELRQEAEHRRLEKAEKEREKIEEMHRWLEQREVERRAQMEQRQQERQRRLEDRLLQQERQRQERMERFRTLEASRVQSQAYTFQRMEHEFAEQERRRAEELLWKRKAQRKEPMDWNAIRAHEVVVSGRQSGGSGTEGGSPRVGGDSGPLRRGYRSRVMERVRREELVKKREEEEERRRREELIEKRKRYGKVVRDVFLPKADEALVAERVRRVEKIHETDRVREKIARLKAPMKTEVSIAAIFKDRTSPRRSAAASAAERMGV